MSLKIYRRKRKFDKTPEPAPSAKKSKAKKNQHLRFVIQKHAASRTHYDFRLEFDGALKSWAVPRGPSLTSGNPRLAVFVEDHPLAYGDFEGVIPKGNYGAGTVMIWDTGTYVERGSKGRADSEKNMRRAFAEGHLTFILDGKKLQGEFALVKIKKKGAEENAWLLVKKHDAYASRYDVLRDAKSATTGRTMEEIAAQAEKKGDIWLPGKGKSKTPPAKKTLPERKVVKREAAKPSMPRRVRPMEPAFATAPSAGEGWIFERFRSGVRALAQVEKGQAKLLSRSFIPLDRRYPAIVDKLKKLGENVLLDGELMGHGAQAHFEISDLLFADGKDLREQPLKARKQRLSKLKLSPGLSLAKVSTDATEVEPTAMGKVVAKKLDSVYHSGITRDWVQFRMRKGKAAATVARDLPPFTHPTKVFWPDEGYTKGDLLAYYETVADTMMPYLVDHPQSLHRQPDGIRNEGFFHKDMTSFLPRRIQTERIHSGSSGKTINYALCQDKWSLLYLVNLGCIEINPWLSKRGRLDRPDYIVIDLDPDDSNTFAEVVKVAREVKRVLDSVGVKSYPKTSGASGLHICIPTGAKYDFDTGREFAEAVCRKVHAKFPKLTSVERNPAKRRGLIYLDYMQNRRAQTLAAPYCVRPRAKATVSTPLKWAELTPSLRPEIFTIKTLPRRLAKLGDLWRPMLGPGEDIERAMRRLLKPPHK